MAVEQLQKLDKDDFNDDEKDEAARIREERGEELLLVSGWLEFIEVHIIMMSLNVAQQSYQQTVARWNLWLQNIPQF